MGRIEDSVEVVVEDSVVRGDSKVAIASKSVASWLMG